MTESRDLVSIDERGKAHVKFHGGQRRAWNSQARFVFIFSGFQGGKTSFIPWWLNREIDRTESPKGENDYIAVTASFDLFKLKFLPEMRRVFELYLKRGRYWTGNRVIELCDPKGNFWAASADDLMYGRIILRSAQAEGGLESTTAKAAVMDECGQDEFRVDQWEAIQRRVSMSQGRILGATTLYNRGWTKTQVYDRWRSGDKDFDVVQFPSYQNPSFPKEEYDRLQSIWPKWKFNMFARGEFDTPEGLIYDVFDPPRHTIDPFPIPDDWPRYMGIDFGGVHMAAILLAEKPETKQLFQIDEYLVGRKTIFRHAKELALWKAKQCFGGAGSEDQYRMDFGAAGLPIIEPPFKEVEIGIDRVYATLSTDGLIIFKTCQKTIDEYGIYSRELDRDGQPTEKIKDKSEFHLLDATRYVVGSIRQIAGKVKVRRLA